MQPSMTISSKWWHFHFNVFLHRYSECHHWCITWWRHHMENFPRYWPFVRGIHRSPVNSPHKGQWRGALMFSLICAWTNGRVNNWDASDLRRHRAHYDVTVMTYRVRIEVVVQQGVVTAPKRLPKHRLDAHRSGQTKLVQPPAESNVLQYILQRFVYSSQHSFTFTTSRW